MSNQSFLGLPPIPSELKSLTSFIQRADELKAQDPVVAYWCAYYAAQQGIAIKASAPTNAKFLSALITALEGLRSTIGPSEAIDVESVSSIYIEDFALRVFNVADNEDRNGKATRSTARKFLAAATFLEVLRVFEDKHPWETHTEKVRYAKWKAADIAKALREGRVPNPGLAGLDSSLPDPASQFPPVPGIPVLPHTTDLQSIAPFSVPSSQSARRDSTGSAASRPVGGSWSAASRPENPSSYVDSAILEDEGFSEAPLPSHKHSHSSVITGPLPPVGEEGTAEPPSPPSSIGSASTQGRSVSHATSHIAHTSPKSQALHGHTRTSSTSSASSQSAQSTRSANRVPSPTHFVPRDIPASSPGYTSPQSQPSSVTSPSLPTHRPTQPYTPPTGPLYTGPPLLPSQPPINASGVSARPPPPIPPSTPLELTPNIIAKAQKHCRFAISALDYEDAAQARKELHAALSLLGDV